MLHRPVETTPSLGQGGGLDGCAEGLASTYAADERSEVQKQEFIRFLSLQVERGATPLILVGQVNPILEARLDSAMRSDFRAYVDELAELHPAGLVRNEELPRHTPGDYVPDDLMHINHETRLKFTERLAELLEERVGWVRRRH